MLQLVIVRVETLEVPESADLEPMPESLVSALAEIVAEFIAIFETDEFPYLT
jgi:hypothetical protein